MNEDEIVRLEEQFPALAELAFQRAYQDALDRGLSVLVADDGGLFEVYPDGRREFRKPLAPRTKVIKGTMAEIQ